MSRLRVLPPLLACLLLAACAEVKYTLQLDPQRRAGDAARVWPAPPQVPRYRYVGQLTGEDNFVSDEADRRNVAVKVFEWLVGLVGNDAKTVLQRPQTGATDAQGRIYVTDISRHAVFVFDPAGRLLVWQHARERVRFVTPIGIAPGKDGEVLVADADLGRVFRLDRDGRPLGDFGGDVLKRPTGLARDPQRGRVYVADTYAHDVKVFADDGRLLETIGRRGEDAEGLNFPTHLAFAGDRLYVADTMNARVQVFDADGKPVRSVGRRGLNMGNFVRPKGVAVDASGNMYVVESYHDYLLVFNSKGEFLMPLGGTGRETGQFFLPSGVWSDRQDRIYVSDMFNGRVMIFQFLGGD